MSQQITPLPPPRTLDSAIDVPNGWKQLANVVKADDEREVEDQHDKINVTLIFSLLLSIVLAQFLTRSVDDVRPDNQATMVDLLRQLAAQTRSFSLSPHFVNATLPAGPPSQSFVLSQAAVRVTTLWTASLLVNVFGASFGLLTKVWLQPTFRAAGTSPKAYLRDWILSRRASAAHQLFSSTLILSFMLQISLGLFVTGLFVYTLDAHKAGDVFTFPIIAGWALMALLTIFAPLLSPYRLPYSESALVPIRSRLARWYSCARVVPAAASWGLIGDKAYVDDAESSDIDLLVAIYATRMEEELFPAAWNALKHFQARPEVYLTFVRKLIDTVYPPEPAAFATAEKSRGSLQVLDLRSLPGNVHGILNDLITDLLYDEVIRQAGNNDTKQIEWSRWMEDCIGLLMAHSSVPLPAWTNSGLGYFMTPSRAEKFWNVVLRLPLGETNKRDLPLSTASVVFTHIFERFGPALERLSAQDLSTNLADILIYCFCRHEVPSQSHGYELCPTIAHHKTDIPVDSLVLLGKRLIARLSKETYPEMYWHVWLVDMARTIFHIHGALPQDSEARRSLNTDLVAWIRTMLTQGKNTSIFLRFATGISAEKVLVPVASDLYMDAYLSMELDWRNAVLANINASLIWQLDHVAACESDWDAYVRLHPIETCHLLLSAVRRQQERHMLPLPGSEAETALIANYCRIWSTLSEGMRTLRSCGSLLDDESTDGNSDDGAQEEEDKAEASPALSPVPLIAYSAENEELALRCLEEITALDRLDGMKDMTDEQLAAWVVEYDPSGSFVNDVVIEALGEVASPSDDSAFPRLRRVKNIKRAIETKEKAEDANEVGSDSTSDSFDKCDGPPDGEVAM